MSDILDKARRVLELTDGEPAYVALVANEHVRELAACVVQLTAELATLTASKARTVTRDQVNRWKVWLDDAPGYDEKARALYQILADLGIEVTP